MSAKLEILRRAVHLAIQAACRAVGHPGAIVDVHIIPTFEDQPTKVEVQVMPLTDEQAEAYARTVGRGN